MKAKLSCLLLIFFVHFSFGQQQYLSSKAEISVLTIGPGTSLNDAFGHSGFRVKDTTGLDVVFNYGVYDFEAPNFYLKFARGKLDYLIGVNYYRDFYASYVNQNRTIDEQILNLSSEEKHSLYNYLLNNYKPENRRYKYDFFYNNCATKIKDVLKINVNNNLIFNKYKNYIDKTYRTLIQEKLHWNSWGSLGIDIALGSIIDRQATPEEHMFLPENIYRFFKEATFENGENLIKKQQRINVKKNTVVHSNFLFSPIVTLSVLSLLTLFITYRDFNNNNRTKWLDFILFITSGLIGVFLLLLWFATDHTATGYNYNLLWAFPFNLFAAFKLFSSNPPKWVKKYLKSLLIMLCLMVFHWIMKVQVFAIALIPLLLAISVRYFYLIRNID